MAIGKMKDRVPEHSSTWRDRWEAMNGYLEEAEDGEIAWDRDYRGRARSGSRSSPSSCSGC